jgi:hypothetical protein
MLASRVAKGDHGAMRTRAVLVAGVAVALVVVGAVLLWEVRGNDSGSADGSSGKTSGSGSLASGVALMEALDCKGKPLVVTDATGAKHRARGTGFLVGSRVLMGVEHMIPQTPGFICGYRARLGGEWYRVDRVAVWSERGEDDRRGIDIATVTLSADAPGHIFSFAPESAAVGTKVTVLGHPLGGALRASEGTVTKERQDYGKPTLAARFSPDIQGGDSGSPVLNASGEVVSVLSRIITTANLTADGSHHWGGIDLPAWWGADITSDLCTAYPDGGIPGCDGTTNSKPVKVIVPVSLK